MFRKIVLSFIAIGLMSIGAGRSYVYFTNRSPTQITLNDYLATKSSASWVKLTDCDLDLLEALQLQSRVLKKDKGVLIPVRIPGAKPTSKASAFLFTTSERWDQLILSLPETTTQPAPRDVVEGMVLGTFDRDHERMVSLLREKGVAAHDVLIISDGARPDISDVAMFVVLCFVGVFLLGLALRKRAAVRAGPPPLPVT